MKRDAYRTLVLIAMAMAVAMNISALAGPDRALVESSVFRIEIEPPRRGTGFLVDDGGWAVTNDHVIRGAAAATAVFEDGTEAEISVWVAWPDHDLALIRLDLDRPRRPLPVASELPSLGDNVWAWGYPGLGWTVTSGIVNGIREGERFGKHPESQWIQIDAPLNSGNSGGPLVNARSQAVGVNTFARLADGRSYFNNTYFAISAMHIHDLLRSRPADPMKFADLPESEENRAIDWSEIMPSVAVERDAPAARMTHHAGALKRQVRQSFSCRRCSGSGEITRRVRSGYTGDGPFRRPRYTTHRRTCNACGGGGRHSRVNTNVILPRLHRFAEAVAEHEDDGRRASAFRAEATQQMRESMRRIRSSVPNVLPQSVSGVSQPGDVIVLYTPTVQAFNLDGLDSPVYVTSELVVLSDARIALLEQDRHHIVGGILAGYIGDDPEEQMPVIQHGFVIGY